MNRLLNIIMMIGLLLLLQLIVCSVIPFVALLETVFMYVVYVTWHHGLSYGRLACGVAIIGYLLLGRFTGVTALALGVSWMVFEQISIRLLTNKTLLSHTLQSILVVGLIESIAYSGDVTMMWSVLGTPPTFFVVALINILALCAVYVFVIQRRDTLHAML